MRCILFSFKNKLITNPRKLSGKTSARGVCVCVYCFVSRTENTVAKFYHWTQFFFLPCINLLCLGSLQFF